MPFIIRNFGCSEIKTQYIEFVSVSCTSAFLGHLICLASLLRAPPTTDCQVLSVTLGNMWARTGWVALNAVGGAGGMREWCSQMHIATPSNICNPMTSWKKLSLRRITFGTEVRGFSPFFLPLLNSSDRKKTQSQPQNARVNPSPKFSYMFMWNQRGRGGQGRLWRNEKNSFGTGGLVLLL